jgi:hypothetical protein
MREGAEEGMSESGETGNTSGASGGRRSPPLGQRADRGGQEGAALAAHRRRERREEVGTLRCRPGSICRQPRSSRARFTPSPGSRERGGRGRVREGFFLSGSQLS